MPAELTALNESLLLQQVRQMVDTNVTAVAVLTKLFAAGMVERNRGHIINISSVAAHHAYPGIARVHHLFVVYVHACLNLTPPAKHMLISRICFHFWLLQPAPTCHPPMRHVLHCTVPTQCRP